MSAFTHLTQEPPFSSAQIPSRMPAFNLNFHLNLVWALAAILAAFTATPAAHAQTYSAWRTQNFTPAQLADPAISGPAADPDGDGLTNLQEYVFVGTPTLAETNLAPTLEPITTTGNTTLTLTYRERTGLATSGVRVDLESTELLTHWLTPNTVPQAQRLTYPTYDLVTLIDPAPLAPNPLFAAIPDTAAPTRRFLRLRLDTAPLPTTLQAPTNPTLTPLSPTLYELRWNDLNRTETAHRIERLTPSTTTSATPPTWQTLATLPPDTNSYQHPTANYLNGYTYRVTALRSTDNTSAPSTPASLPDTDADGIPDILELGENWTGLLGTYPTYFNQSDTDGDGIPDGWEIAHGLNPNDPTDALVDPNGNGVTNLDEYLEGTDPNLNFYQGIAPLITVVDGPDQLRRPGQFLPRPLRVRVAHPDGSAWSGAPVRFTARADEGLLSLDTTGDQGYHAALTVNADLDGYAQVWLKCP